MTKDLTGRQAAILIFFSIVSHKFIILPSLISSYAKNNAYLSIMIGLFIDFGILLVMLWFMKKNPNKTFYEICNDSFGKVLTKIIFILFFLYFFIKGLVLIKETNNYLLQVLFDELPWLFFIIPNIFLLGYIMLKGLRVLGRSCELLFIIIFIGITLSMLISLKNFELINLLPFAADGIKPIFDGAFFSSFAFGDYIFLFLFMGNIKYTPKTNKTIIKYSLLAIGTVINFFIIFVCSFGPMAINQGLAVSDISLNSFSPATIGRLDWLIVIIWNITLIIQTQLLFISANKSLNYIFSFKRPLSSIILIIGILFILITLTFNSMEFTLFIITSLPFVLVILVIQIIIPLCLPANYLILRKKKYGQFYR